MEFRLIYDGILRPEQQGVKDNKQEIRDQLHPQLSVLWHDRLGLRNRLFTVGPHQFAALITHESRQACTLDLLVLHRGPARGVFNGKGDLDNRVKTLIDGLRLPRQPSELPESFTLSAGPAPFLCLLENDDLVHEFSVTTDRLLRPADERGDDGVIVIIRVTLISAAGLPIAYAL